MVVTKAALKIKGKIQKKIPLQANLMYSSFTNGQPSPANGKIQKKIPLQVKQISSSLVDDQLSAANAAFHVAMLKRRFADIIFKANHKEQLMSHGDKANPLKLENERKRLVKQQLAEKARLEEEFKAAEATLQIHRQKEREATRIALEKMVKTVEFNNNQNVMKDFEVLLCCKC